MLSAPSLLTSHGLKKKPPLSPSCVRAETGVRVGASRVVQGCLNVSLNQNLVSAARGAGKMPPAPLGGRGVPDRLAGFAWACRVRGTG